VLIEVPGNEDLKKAYQQVERLKKEGRR